ncbi:MAG: glycosyltransferase family 4 protein [Luteolibacter sp.]
MSKSKLHVAILADYPLPPKGKTGLGRAAGIGATWLSQLAEMLGKDPSLEITWISLRRDGGRNGIEEVEHGGIRYIICSQVKTSIDVALGLIPSKIKLGRILEKVQPDVIHAWGLERAYPAALAGFKGPGILSIQGLLSELREIGCLPNGWQWKLQARFESSWVKNATVVVCESPWACERCEARHGHADVRRIEYGVHTSFCDLEWSPDPEKPRVLFVGNLTEGKGFDLLLDAFEHGSRPTWELLVAGDGPLSVRAKGIDGITLLGVIDWQALQKEQTKAWCLVAPTLADTGPMVVKEARVVGLPVVGSRNGGLRDYVKDGLNGYQVDPLNAPALREALDKITADYSRLVEMGGTNVEADRELFRAGRAATEWSALYKEVVKSTETTKDDTSIG